jgi:hypothetical protein
MADIPKQSLGTRESGESAARVARSLRERAAAAKNPKKGPLHFGGVGIIQ